MSVSIVDMLKYPSISALAKYLSQGQTESVAVVQGQKRAKVGGSSRKEMDNTDIAVIGMGCRFPGANNYQEFWQNLEQGINSISEIPSQRWEVEKYYSPNPQEGKSISKWGGFIEEIESFDAHFFGISPREAQRMDPQQRLMLELTWSCIEDAGYAPSQLSGSAVGVFIGVCNYDYDLLQNGNQRETDGHTGTGTWNCMIPNRISYFFNFHGPSIPVDTACSSSLVALHQAINALHEQECQTALVGGVSIFCTPTRYIQMSQLGMLSPVGQCKSFDQSADGYVRGEGAGVIFLKPLAKAIEDLDQIYGVIRGSAVNHGGRARTLTSPNVYAQAQVLCAAYTKANVAPNTISYIEVHGTGTPLGDPIEINSLKRAFRQLHQQYHLLSVDHPYCGLGTVKTNIGHLEAAAGIAGLIKLLLAFKNQLLPKIVNFQQLNPRIEFKGSPFYLVCETQPWQQLKTDLGEIPRRAGISSFGVGGVNAHVILEEAPIGIQNSPSKIHSEDSIERPYHLLVLSAKNEQALAELQQRYLQFLTSNQSVSLADVCYTANTGREHFNHRLAVVADSREKLIAQLTELTTKKSAEPNQNTPKIAFLFTGQGSQYINMGRQLYETQPIFRQTLEQCNEILRPDLESSLLEVLYPTQVEEQVSFVLNQTAYTQPALFAFEYALYQLWKSWGIEPDVVMGHSVGEYVAACVAGVVSLEDGLKLIAQRGQLMQELPLGGEMVSLMATEEKVRQVIAPFSHTVSIAAINSPESVVISGSRADIATICQQLSAQSVKTKRLEVSHAFHSPLMTPMLADFAVVANQVTYNPPQIPLISNVTGELASEQITTADYWVSHVLQTVQFAKSIQTLRSLGYEVFLEIGPKPTLLGMGRQCLTDSENLWLLSMRPGVPECQQLLTSLGELYVAGVKIDWSAFVGDYPYQKVTLPTYPFQRKRYWYENSSMNGNKLNNLSDKSQNHKSNAKENKLEVTTPTTTNQREPILLQLRSLVANLIKAKPEEVRLDTSFLEMGADSIVIMDAIRTIENTYGFKITVRQFFEELPNINALATYIHQNLPPEWIITDSQQVESEPELKVQQQTQPTIPLAKPTISTSRQNLEQGETTSETALERIMRQQLEVVSQSLSQVVSQQLEFLHNNGLTTKNLLSSENGKSQTTAQTKTPIVPFAENNQQKDVTTSSRNSSVQVKSEQTPLQASSLSPSFIEGLNQQQQRHLEALIAVYNQRTQKSKQRSQTYRPVLADSRAVAGFRLSTKEMVYPIIGQRASGAKFWDVDGNEYVDISMGFGVLLFGHAPSFITQAVFEQMELGIQIGPQSCLAGEVAQLICQLTNMERVTFCNSGTEAVMTALRLARTATGRTKIALFAGSYHGHFDGVLATVANGQMMSVPMTPGVSQHTVEDVLVLDYGNPESLKILQACSHELAAVLVEPVQSRQPHLQPQEFLRQLRQLTEVAGSALIFDEVLTGFRIHPGGAQAWFGIQADIAIYGKIVGGGMPIGIVAGLATYMNGIDGGLWNYGDTSYPHAQKTFFAGTFNKNHLGMATARAVLKYLLDQGPTLQQQLNQRTSQFAATLNAYFEHEKVPIQIVHFGSLFRFTFNGNLDLLFYHLLLKGVYIWEGRNCFLSTAHTDQDLDFLIQAVKDSVEELRSGGFLPLPSVSLPETDKQIEGIL